MNRSAAVPEAVDLGEGVFKLADAISKICLQLQYLSPDPHTSAQFRAVKGFRQIIISSGVKPGDNILFAEFCGEQNEIRRGSVGDAAQSTTDLHTIKLRHHPVENGQRRSAVTLEHTDSQPSEVF